MIDKAYLKLPLYSIDILRVNSNLPSRRAVWIALEGYEIVA
jgi:hypothetical protein